MCASIHQYGYWPHHSLPTGCRKSSLGQLPPLLVETPQSHCYPLGTGTQKDPREPEWLEGTNIGMGREEDAEQALGPGWSRPHWVSDPTLRCFVMTACKIAEAKILLRGAICMRCFQSLLRQIWTLAKKRYHQIVTEQLKICGCSWMMLSCKSSICNHLPVLIFNVNILYFQGLVGYSN